MRPSTSSLLEAEFRRGAKDLQNVVLNAFPQGPVAATSEPGTIFNPTPQMVTHSIKGERTFDDMLATAATKHAEKAPQRDQSMER